METAIILSGRADKEEYYDAHLPANSNNHWYPWLTKQLMVEDIFTVAVEFPRPWQPRYEAWKKEFERFDCGEHTVLIGYSCGAGFLVRWLSEERERKVNQVILVAPWLNPDHDPAGDTADFFDFTIDPGMVSRTKGITIFHSDNDYQSIHASVRMIREQVTGIDYQEFHNHGHFCLEDLGTEQFPELASYIVTKKASS